ncbi:unnamed protein product [Clonostachys byssicola]|uniref:F-box domain-containing protein n=1 Tax=Clonostachys byssicola TaxID=160290 RepID=A0A9N9U3W9_9HYPO|nr:unnamed protein product [Clonostachys byssicola]
MESDRQITGGPFCALCGGTFRAHRADSDTPPLNWTSRIRHATCIFNVMSSHLSHPCYVAWSAAGGPGPANPAADMTVQGLEPYYLADSEDGEESIVFVYHEACWQMLLTRLTYNTGSDPDHEDVAYWLFYTLASVPRWDGRLLPRHGYHGVMPILESNHLRGVLEAVIDYIPFPSISPESHPSQPTIDSGALLSTQDLPVPSYDPFRQLPSEIIWDIIVYLTYDDINNARLSSRHFAMHTSAARLPQKFLASRFSPEMGLGFVLAMDKNETGYADMDWRGLFDNCMSLLQQPGNLGDGFRNRRRIWICLQDIAATVEILLTSSDFNTIIYNVPRLAFDGYPLGQRVSCADLEYRDRADPQQIMKNKDPRTRALQLQLDSTTIVSSIEYTTIVFESVPYICGLRVSFPPEGLTLSEQHHEVGILLPSRTKSVPIEKDITLSDFSVCYSPDGIHGFSIFTRDANGRLDRLCIGQTDAVYPHSTNKTLPRSLGSGPILGLLLEFDVRLITIHP